MIIHNVQLSGRQVDITIEGNRFKSIEPVSALQTTDEDVLDATGMAILPPFYNAHTHAAMSLLRGYADDMPLFKWLTEYIWPFEDKLTPDDIQLGSELAAIEMIKSGTVFFNDMYFEIDRTIDVVKRFGMRACIGITVMENHSLATRDSKYEFVRNWSDPTGGRIQLAMAPHAIYTVGTELFRKTVDFARERGIRISTHLAETSKEVQDSIKDFGTTPVRYLDSIGALGPDVIAAHVVHVDDEEIRILRDRGVGIVHNPCSNMKLTSGVFHSDKLVAAGCKIALGTDGSSSNNNLDMMEEMKFAALLSKCAGTPESAPAQTVFNWATVNSAQMFGIDAGVIAVGKLADAILVDLNDARLLPGYNLISDMVYATNSSCIDTVICDGRVIMRHRHIDGEEEVLEKVASWKS